MCHCPKHPKLPAHTLWWYLSGWQLAWPTSTYHSQAPKRCCTSGKHSSPAVPGHWSCPTASHLSSAKHWVQRSGETPSSLQSCREYPAYFLHRGERKGVYLRIRVCWLSSGQATIFTACIYLAWCCQTLPARQKRSGLLHNILQALTTSQPLQLNTIKCEVANSRKRVLWIFF